MIRIVEGKESQIPGWESIFNKIILEKNHNVKREIPINIKDACEAQNKVCQKSPLSTK